MAGANLVVHDQEVQAALKRLADIDKRGMLNEIGGYMVSSTQARFRRSEAPDGSKWETLSYITKLARIGGSKAFKKRGGLTARARRLLGGLLPLIDRGHLMKSIHYKVSGSTSTFGISEKYQVAIGTNMIYGAIHQFGGNAGRGRKVKIPARPYLGTSRADRLEIRDIMHSYVQRVIPR